MHPAVLIIPGSFAPSTFYVPLRERVQSLGYDGYILPLQTVGLRPSPPPSMMDDAAFIRTEVKKLVDQEQEVILLAHSYGGVPMSQSTKGLTIAERAECGSKGGIKHLIYSSAVAPVLGQALVGNDTSGLPQGIRDAIENSDPYFPRSVPLSIANATFNDYPANKVSVAAQMFEEQAVSGYVDKLTWPGYSNVSVTYINTLEDQVIPPAQQQGYIDTLRAKSPSVNVSQIDAGHFAMYTQLDKYMGVLEAILSGF